MIIAVCGILFLSAGMVIITADNADPAAPQPPVEPPTATIELPTPTQVVSAPVEQQPQPLPPTDVPPPTAVPPTDVPPPTAEPVVVQPTEVVANAQVVPTNVESTIIPPTVVVQQPNEPLGTLPPAPVVPTAENPVVIPTIALPTAEVNGNAPPPQPAPMVVMTQVNGRVGVGLKADFSGIVVTLKLPDGQSLQTVTDSAGNFSFPNLAAGTYQLSAGSAGYLSSQTSFTLAQGQTLTLPVAMLVGGDTNLDNKIDMADASLIAANFDSATVVAGADLNHDGVVDIRDLTAIGAYFGKVGPTAWQP